MPLISNFFDGSSEKKPAIARSLRSSRLCGSFRHAPLVGGLSRSDVTGVSLLASILLILLPAHKAHAATSYFLRQTITFPHRPTSILFSDIGGDGRSALLAIDSVDMNLLIYRQGPSGFTNTPDQIIKLPPQTSWIAPYEVAHHRGLDLLMSTANGLFLYPQDKDVFKSEPAPLIQANQIFTNNDPPILISLLSNAPIPVISATQAVLYRQAKDGLWHSDKSATLQTTQSSWRSSLSQWSLGPTPATSLSVWQSFRSNPTNAQDTVNEGGSITKLAEIMNKTGPVHEIGTNRVDLNKDGQEDLVLWEAIYDLDPKTDVYVFLRGADGRLPERPNQILHCRGFPLPVLSTENPQPLADLKCDGAHQLVLVELKSSLTSYASVLEMVMSRGLEWALTIRSFNQGAFSSVPDAAIPLTAILAGEQLRQWPLFICGDFNGDGRPDLVVQRSETLWHIFDSTNTAGWFTAQPSFTFETPVPGSFEILDINGDGRSDIVLRPWDDPRIFIYLTKP